MKKISEIKFRKILNDLKRRPEDAASDLGVSKNKIAAHGGEIHKAAQNGDLKKLRQLLQAKPKLLHAVDSMQRTPLHVAARRNNKAIVTYLLLKGANVAARGYNKFTPLHLTSSPDVARLLIKAKADINAKDVFDQRPLQRAVDDGNLPLIRVFQSVGQKLAFNQLISLHRFKEVAAALKVKPWLAKPPNDCLSSALLRTQSLKLLKLWLIE